MDKSREYLVWLANAEFGGGSFNGPSLMETLRALSPADAASTDTYEGHSAWGVALHVLYFKYLVGTELGATLPEYGHEKKDWPSLPADKSADAYNGMIGELEAFHGPVVRAFAEASAEKLDGPMPAWDVPLWKAFTWLVSHDTNHNTQIRNMGLPALREK